MLNMQTLFALCPRGGTVGYYVDIPVQDAQTDTVVRIVLPEGNTEMLQPENGVVRLEHQNGQGLWRYVADLVNNVKESEVFDQIIIEVIILEESDEKTRVTVAEAVDKIVSSDTKSIIAGAANLHKDLRGLEIPELLRLLYCERDKGINKGIYTDQKRIVLLKECLVRPVKSYLATAVAIMADRLGAEQDSSVAVCEFDIMVKVAIPPQHKWMYFLKVFGRMETRLFYNGKSGLRNIADQLIRMTPVEYRSLVLQTAEELIDQTPSCAGDIVDLFKKFNHRSGISKLLSALERDISSLPIVCDMLKDLDYREAVDQLRVLLSMSEAVGAIKLIKLLSEWKDTESIPVILEKLETEFNKTDLFDIMIALRNFGDKSLAIRAEEIASRSPDDKASIIRNAVKSWI